METPCIKVCQLDKENLCMGCGRTLQEISDWTRMSDAERAQVMHRLAGVSVPYAERTEPSGSPADQHPAGRRSR